MNEFINWETMSTYGGCLAAVLMLTQFTKNISIIQKIPTQIWSYILSLIVLFPASFFTNTLSASYAFQILFNGVIISMAANGAHQGIKKLAGENSNGEIIIDSNDPSKRTYRLKSGTTETLLSKNYITLRVKSVQNDKK